MLIMQKLDGLMVDCQTANREVLVLNLYTGVSCVSLSKAQTLNKVLVNTKEAVPPSCHE